MKIYLNRKIYILMLILLFISCSDNPTESKSIFIEATEAFNLELNTWSPDWIGSWSTRGGSLVIYLQTERFGQNQSNKTYDVSEFLHRGVVLYQFVSDTIVVLGTGKGKIVDGFNRVKNIVYPNETYKHVSRLDSVQIISDLGLYYTNFWYEGELSLAKQNYKISPLLGKRVE